MVTVVTGIQMASSRLKQTHHSETSATIALLKCLFDYLLGTLASEDLGVFCFQRLNNCW